MTLKNNNHTISRNAFSAFKKDSYLVSKLSPSSNYNDRKYGIRASMIILHYTGMYDHDISLKWLCHKNSNVSAHYFIHENGEVIQLVNEHKRAWHAGISHWDGYEDINSRSIGIEIANCGHEFGYKKFTPYQIEAVRLLITDIISRHKIKRQNILAHSDIAFLRKDDPGEKFPWQYLADHNIGLYANHPTSLEKECYDKNKMSIKYLQSILRKFGYGIVDTGFYDLSTSKAVIAFKRHFMSVNINQKPNIELFITLEKLIKKKNSNNL